MSENKPYEYVGTIHSIGKTQTFPSGFARRDLVLKTSEGEWDNYAKFDFIKGKTVDMTQVLNSFVEGQKVKVVFVLDAFESKKNPGSWFSNAKAIKIEKVGGEVSIPTTRRPVPSPAEPPARVSMDDMPDDMPF